MDFWISLLRKDIYLRVLRVQAGDAFPISKFVIFHNLCFVSPIGKLIFRNYSNTSGFRDPKNRKNFGNFLDHVHGFLDASLSTVVTLVTKRHIFCDMTTFYLN